MNRYVVRLFALWALLLFVFGACAPPPGSGAHRTFNALGVVLVALIVELVTLASAMIFGVFQMKNSQQRFAMFIGVFFGLIASVIIIVSVPINVQYLMIGGILGLGSNLLSTRNQSARVKTAVGSLAKLVVTASSAVSNAARDTGLPTPPEVALAIGIWCFLGSILLTLAVGNTMSGVTLFPGDNP